MRSLGWTLIQPHWCPYRKRRLGQRHTRMENNLKTQEEDSHLQDKEKGLGRNEPCQHLDLELMVSGTVRKINIFCLNHPVCVLCYGSLSSLIHSNNATWKKIFSRLLPCTEPSVSSTQLRGTQLFQLGLASLPSQISQTS